MGSLEDSAVAFFEGVRTRNYWSLVSFSILYFDYILTLPTEIERFWKRLSLSYVSVLFILNRYLSLLGHIPIIYEYFGHFSEKRCHQLQSYHAYFAVVVQIIVFVLQVIRTYALYNRSKRVLVLLMSVGFVGVIVGIVCTVFTRKPNEDAIPHLYNVPICQLSLSVQQVYYLLGCYIVLLLADATVFILTVVKVAQIRQHFPEGLFEIMLRDGIIYFGILVVLNISNICTLLLADPPEKVISLTATNDVEHVDRSLDTQPPRSQPARSSQPVIYRQMQLGDSCFPTRAIARWCTILGVKMTLHCLRQRK